MSKQAMLVWALVLAVATGWAVQNAVSVLLVTGWGVP